MQTADLFTLHYCWLVLKFFAAMLLQSLTSLLNAMGLTILAVIVGLLIFIIPLAVKAHRIGIKAVKEDWQKNLKGAIAAPLIVWGLLIALSFARAIYEEHRTLLASNDSLRAELAEAKGAAQKARSEPPPPKPATIPTAPKKPQPIIEQKSYGANSPNVVGSGNQVNINASLPDRRIPTEKRAEIIKFLSARKAKVGVSAPLNDREAYQLASDIHSALKDAGWDMQNEPVRIMMSMGQPRVGVLMKIHGEPVGPGQIVEVHNDDPAAVFGRVMDQLKIELRAQRYKSIPEGSIQIEVGAHPPE